MRRLILTVLIGGCVFVSTISFPKTTGAQEAAKDPRPAEAPKPVKPIPVYRLEFAVRELEDGKRLNTRTYTMLLQEGPGPGKIRVGNRVPYTTGKDQFRYFDVGMNIDLRIRELDDRVLLNNLSIDISSVMKDEARSEGNPNPVLRQARTEITATIPLGKPTVVTTLDDVSSNRRYEVEVTATKVK